ncbi:MAG TPA: RsbRD N-terminal domain-containing protein [Chthoniobacterales bacterium]|nr:RsbRD N-terminal domain-containing protein [Chthoniobacterales bacterium]
MIKSPEPDADSVNAQLAGFLSARKEEMIRAWARRVDADPAIRTERLTRSQLRNHLPQLFDDLAQTLRRYGSEDVAGRSERDAEKHGAERWQEGFSLAELLREVLHLRGVLIYHLKVFEESHADFGTAARLFAQTAVHQFLDELAIDAAEQFLASEKQARRGASGVVL